MHATFNRPLVYRIDDGDGPVIMTVSRVVGGALDAASAQSSPARERSRQYK
jgi:hypothetical protein